MSNGLPFDRAIDSGMMWFGLLDGDDVPAWRWMLFVPAILAFVLLTVFNVVALFGGMLWPREKKNLT